MNRNQNLNISLAGQVAIVTGGGSGIGRGIVDLFARAGAKVLSFDLQAGPIGAEEARSPGMVVEMKGDVTSERDCEQAVNHAVKVLGGCHLLVNAAGVIERTRRTINQDLDHWKRVMDINLLGTFQMSQAAARHMVGASVPGSIVNFASITGLTGFRASNAYGVSKAAVAMLTKTMSSDLAMNNIRVNAVAPGLISTPMTANLQGATSVDQNAFTARIPLGRFGDVPEVSKAVLFLSSSWASYITGAVLPIDGGWTAFGGPLN